MSVTCGFFNSLDGDRRYDTAQISKMFDGLIIDGVFASIGTCFVAKAGTGLTVNVGAGKAWFNHSWLENDAVLTITMPASEALLNRYDALVLDFNSSDYVRDNVIQWVSGSPASNPSLPRLVSTATRVQKPICYIYRAAGSTTITDANISNAIGTAATPFVTGILRTLSVDELLGQWQSQLDQFIAREQTDFTSWMGGEKAEYDAWFDQLKTDLISEQNFLDSWIANEQADFNTWFDSVKNTLGTDAAGNLQLQIRDIQSTINTLQTRVSALQTENAAQAAELAVLRPVTGTWTPTLTDMFGGTTPTYQGRAGGYIKIGPLLFLTFTISLSSKGGLVDALRIGGFSDIAAFSTVSNVYAGSISTVGGLVKTETALSLYRLQTAIAAWGNSLVIMRPFANTTLKGTDITNGFFITGSITIATAS